MNAERLRRAALRGFFVGLGSAGALSAVVASDHARGEEILGACVTGCLAGASLALGSLVELASAERPAGPGRNVRAALAVFGISLVGAALGIFQVGYTVVALQRTQLAALQLLKELVDHVAREPGVWLGLALLGAAPFPAGTFVRLAWPKGEVNWFSRGMALALANGALSLLLGIPGFFLIPSDRGIFAAFVLAIAVPSALLVELADALFLWLWPPIETGDVT